MSTIVITNAYALVNSMDLSDHVKKVKLTLGADSLEDSAMGSGYHTHKGGAKTFKADLELFQDFAANKVDQTVRPLVGAAPFPLVIKGDSSSGTNNTFTMTNVIVSGDYSPLDAAFGVLAPATVSFVPGSGFTFAVT